MRRPRPFAPPPADHSDPALDPDHVGPTEAAILKWLRTPDDDQEPPSPAPLPAAAGLKPAAETAFSPPPAQPSAPPSPAPLIDRPVANAAYTQQLSDLSRAEGRDPSIDAAAGRAYERAIENLVDNSLDASEAAVARKLRERVAVELRRMTAPVPIPAEPLN